MNALAWTRYLEEQASRHAKRVFTLTELANVAGHSVSVANVTLARLVRSGVLERLARGLYAAPGGADPEEALPWIDNHAYLTGAWALFRHGLITQIPRAATGFTDRRPFRSRRATSAGEFELVVVRPPVYAPPRGNVVAPPEQALCDVAWLASRRGVSLASLYTFRRLDRLRPAALRRHLRRYPDRTAAAAAEIMGRDLEG